MASSTYQLGYAVQYGLLSPPIRRSCFAFGPRWRARLTATRGGMVRRRRQPQTLPTTTHPLSLPRSLTACPYFCSLVMSASPCLTTSAYCLFLSSGRFVSMMPFTRSIVHGIRSAAMNFARSLQHILEQYGQSPGGRSYRSRKSTETPKSVAMLFKLTIR